MGKQSQNKMRLLGFTFQILTGCGCWLPNSWRTPQRRLMYHAYTIFILLLINTFTLSQVLDIILTVDNADDFTDNFYMMLAMIVSCFKMFSLLINRGNIAMLTNILMNGPCTPLEPEEIEIRQKFDKLIQTNTLHYMILVELTCASTAVASLLTDYRKTKLTFRAWLPFNYSSKTVYHFTYFHQLISLTVGSVLHVACDGLICGLLLHISCQIEILICRLKNTLHDPKRVRGCVIQHNLIFKFACMVNKKFRFTISFQFLVSTLVVCFTLYQLTRTSGKFIEIGLYMSCMLTQIFLYCWYGNEVKLKSLQLTNTIFETEWFTLEKNVQKDLLIITSRSAIPIEFSSAYVIPMNLDSFVGLLKTSYSTYNILQQMQDTNINDK